MRRVRTYSATLFPSVNRKPFLQLVLVDADLPAKVNDRRRVLKTGLQDSLCLFYRTNLVLVEIGGGGYEGQKPRPPQPQNLLP